MRLIAIGAIAALGCHAPTRDFGGIPFPTLERDEVPTAVEKAGAPRVSGAMALRHVTRRNHVELELGSNDRALLAFDCAEPDATVAPARKHGLVLPPPRLCYRCTLVTDEAGPQNPYGPQPHDASLMAIARTLHHYPASFIRAARLDGVAVCTAIETPRSVEREQVGGLADLARRRMLVQVTGSAHQAQATVHHEMYHLFDYAGASYSLDATWQALNPRGFSYGDTTTATPGFVDTYARTNAVEDKASTFAAMMTEDDFCERAAADPIILAKAKLILERITSKVPAGDAAFVRDKLRCL